MSSKKKRMKRVAICQFAEGKPNACTKKAVCKFGDHWFCREHGDRGSLTLAPMVFHHVGGWKKCRGCDAVTWETNLGMCKACRGEKWLSMEDGERMVREPNKENGSDNIEALVSREFVQPLFDFFDVDNVTDLIKAQEEKILFLQAQKPPRRNNFPVSYRH